MVASVSPDTDINDNELFSGEELEMFALADLGEKAVGFRDSQIGRLMIGFALQEIREHANALLEVDPVNVDEIRRIQQKAGVARLFLRFIEEAISSGEVAHEQIIIMESRS